MTTEQLFKQRKKAYPSQDYVTIVSREFLGEFKMAKVSLSLSEKAEWISYFNEQKANALKLDKSSISGFNFIKQKIIKALVETDRVMRLNSWKELMVNNLKHQYLNKTKIWVLADMDADQVTARTKWGATDATNCEMLFKSHNRAKGKR